MSVLLETSSSRLILCPSSSGQQVEEDCFDQPEPGEEAGPCTALDALADLLNEIDSPGETTCGSAFASWNLVPQLH